MVRTREATTILIVDDHVLFRQGLREILENEDDLVVGGEAGNSADAASLAFQTRPDVVVRDVEIPGDSAAVTVGRIRRALPACHIIILSMYDEPWVVRELLALGIRGYLLKSVTRQ